MPLTSRWLLLLVAFLPLLVAQDNANKQALEVPISDQVRGDLALSDTFKEPAILEVHRKKIRQELAGGRAPEWAGEYYYGDGLGANVTVLLAPRSGFVFTWYGCLGLYGKNYGAVSSDKGVITLQPAMANKAGEFGDMATQLVPITWGRRHYLIAADRLIDFANDYNAGFEPRKSAWGSHLLRLNDDKKEATGKPPLPSDYRAYLLDRPIEAHITAVGEVRRDPKDDFVGTATIVLDAGANAGLKPGMRLYVFSREGSGTDARVMRVGAASSEAEATLFGKDARVKPGWKMSTRLLP
jgi:hypothetical protein